MLWRAPDRDAAGVVLEDARRLRAAGDEHAAHRVLEEGVRRFPAAAELWNNLGTLQLSQGKFAAAEQQFRRALELRPGLGEAHTNLGIALVEQGRHAEGPQHFRRAIELDPQLLAARENLATLLTKQLDHDAALAAWDEVLRIKPDHADAHAAKGMLLMREGAYDSARGLFARARGLGLDTPSLALHEAVLEAAVGDATAARSAIEALRGHIEDAEIDWNYAILCLSQGNFAEGWPLYEARLLRSFESPRRPYPFPDWDGTPLDDGTLLIMAEQGLGDEIMFASCYADAVARASRCVIECSPRLERLFARSFPGAQVVGHARGDADPWLQSYPGITRQIHAGSLPRYFRPRREAFPSHNGYLQANDVQIADWRARLARHGEGPCVGIAWSGGLRHTRRALRSIPLSDFARLLRLPGAQFVSLQHDDDGSGARELAALSGAPVHFFAEALADLDDTAALVSALDVVITVCSTVVHLSGALGVRTWVLTPGVAEWRYLDRGEAMPWYPSVRVLRQSETGKWNGVIERVVRAFDQAFVAGGSNRPGPGD